MATKTISIELDVYDWLVDSRDHPSESFSQVIRRMKKSGEKWTGASLYKAITSGELKLEITPEQEAMILNQDRIEDIAS